MKKKFACFAKKIGGVIVIILIIIIIFLVIRFIIGQYRKSMSEKKNEISKIVTYNLNGEDQTVLIEGKEEDLPILVLLHGGPCFPVPFNEGCRGLFPELTKSYVTVYWDQLGCGRNRKTYANGEHLPADISPQDYVYMLKDLLVNLRKDFPDHKVYLFGMSWGSYLTAEIASESPELVDEILVYGQIRRDMFQTDDVIDEIMNYCNNEKEKKFLQECKGKKALTDEEIFHIETLISKYTDGFVYQGKTGEKQNYTALVQIILKYLFSPDYKLRDVLGSLTDSATAEDVAISMIHSDITDSLQNIKVPYKILQGEKDLQTSRYQIEEFMEQNNNPNISLEIVPNCGHIPTTECFSVILEEIKKMKE